MFKNPFSTDRAEHLGEKIFEYFSDHENFQGLLKEKSLIIEGGRGSGKTMFYLYHTYDNKKKEAKSNDVEFKNFLDNLDLVGIHFRADSNFVTAFQHKGVPEEDWENIFAHYLNITLSKRLIDIILDINNEVKFNDEITFKIKDELEILFPNQPAPICFEDFRTILRKEEVKLISFLNNVSTVSKPQLIPNGYLLNLITESIQNKGCLKGKSVHIFIDEYENLLLYQQRIINTLIKHPSPTIFDVGMRKEGLKTHETLTKTEVITPPHDYHLFDFETFSESEYESLLMDVCKKRLKSVFNELNIEIKPEHIDIKYYLGKYSLDEEVNNIDSSQIRKKIQHSIFRMIWGSNWETDSEKDTYYNSIYEIESLMILRLNLCLLERGENPKKLISEYDLYLNKRRSKYTDWIHNNKHGVIYLLVKENKGFDKEYYGFTTFKSLSSGIIRYFLEICEEAFKQAKRKGFDFNNPRPLSKVEQTKAVYYVSSYKIKDIDTFTPYSNRLKLFTVLLGRVFDKLHRDRKSSEPERNHFGTDYEKLTDKSKDFLKSALLYSVFQKTDETKDKSNSIDSNISEFHLNHIYAPCFQISPRKMRKLIIPYQSLEVLINGKVTEAEREANKLSKVKLEESVSQTILFDDL